MLLALKSAVVRAARKPGRWRQMRRMLRFYAQFVGPGSLCFDVGANVGGRTDVFLRLGARRVVAVEPQPACVARLVYRHRSASAQGRLVVVPVALGPEHGTKEELAIADWSTIATMSPEWRRRVIASNRFEGDRWHETALVDVTTLDRLIEAHGVPDFCKIDVEGYEREVLAGLSSPLPAVSIEYTPEFRQAAIACVDRLAYLGLRRFNVSAGESMVFEGDWTDAAGAVDLLRRLEGPAGDVYALL